MLKKYVEITTEIEKLILSFKEPTTVIYSNPKDLPASIISLENTVAIRITGHEFCRALINQFGKPLISTSANISGEENPLYFENISEEIKSEVNFIVPKDYDTSVYRQPSRLIKILPNNKIDHLR